MLILMFLITVGLLITTLVFYIKKNKDFACYFSLGGLIGLIFSVFLLIIVSIVGTSNIRTIEIDKYTYENNSIEFVFMNDEHFYMNYKTYNTLETKLEEGLYVDVHLITPFERLIYFPFLDKDTGYFINDVYFIE